ncbi:MAG: MurR/RpiR family transcriptional regulator [Anaerococcus hydrogenalis]|nr:MurR/RpiR family transcriptional regulator [Anaerococcus hydrogenalis]
MKISIAKSFEEESDFIEDEIKKTDKIGDIINKSKANIQKTVEKTYALIDNEKIEKACQILNKTKKIYLSGVAGSGLICEDFYYKLLRAGADVYYEKDAHTNLSRISHIGKNDLLIAISYGAKTKEVIESFNYAKIKGSSIICISKNENSKLAKDSDVFIKIPSSEKEIRYGAIASRFSSLIITDILYFSYIGQNYDYVVENLKVSKHFTDKLEN